MRLILSFIVALLVFSIVGALFMWWLAPRDVKIGATFSTVYTQSLDLDWQEVYLAILEDLQIKSLRIPVYWSEIEKVQGVYDFDDLDWMMDEARKRQVDVTLVVGVKVPRWPECFFPDWIEYRSELYQKEALMKFIEETVVRYREHPALLRWQVENEAYFPFGECPLPDPKRFVAEIAQVRDLDPAHPVQLTTSGEQALWLITASRADVLGVSLYRVTWNSTFGYWVFPLPSAMYALQQTLASPFVQEVLVSELQVEPWIAEFMREWSIEKQYQAFTEEELRAHIDFARRTRVNEVFLWGVEWWYYLKVHGEDRLWEAGKEILR
ncbi:beta-galactosidase [Patescibacteria group bacterium]|nr:beta-galactosidase [Patescibacteria group bacterium]